MEKRGQLTYCSDAGGYVSCPAIFVASSVALRGAQERWRAGMRSVAAPVKVRSVSMLSSHLSRDVE
jgi:hypothetical protein